MNNLNDILNNLQAPTIVETPKIVENLEPAEKTEVMASFFSVSDLKESESTTMVDNSESFENPVLKHIPQDIEQNFLQLPPDFENILIKTILTRPDFLNKAKNVLKESIFSNASCGKLYKIINEYYSQYNRIPEITEVQLEIKNIPVEGIRSNLQQKLFELNNANLIPRDFMDDYTVQYVKDQMFEQALIAGADFVDKKLESAKQKAKDLIDESQKIEINAGLGDIFTNYNERLDYYQNPEKGLLYSRLKSFNQRLGEGILPGTLNIFLAPPGIGKSMMLSYSIGDFLLQKKKVLLVSMEMANFEFMKRVDADLLDIPISDLKNKELKSEITRKYNELIERGIGELYVQNYAPGTFSAYTLEALLDVYKSHNIDIDVIMLDYLGLMKSDRVNPNVGLYSYIKSIGEEVRAVAKQANTTIISCSQLNRSVFGKDAKDVDNSTISDSMGTAMTADLLVMLIQNEGQKLKNEIMFKITKNRYSGKTDTFKVITNYSKMRFEDCPDEPSQSFVNEPKLQSVDQSAKPLDINSLLNF